MNPNNEPPRTCPKCGSEVEFHHYTETAAHPETYVPHCTECTWEGKPE